MAPAVAERRCGRRVLRTVARSSSPQGGQGRGRAGRAGVRQEDGRRRARGRRVGRRGGASARRGRGRRANPARPDPRRIAAGTASNRVWTRWRPFPNRSPGSISTSISKRGRGGSRASPSTGCARLVDVLGDPQKSYPVIHLTGTNGKGSTARLVTALLVEAGLTVGTYTSPHLQRINERIARCGEPIGDDELAEVLSDLRQLEPLVGEHVLVLRVAHGRRAALVRRRGGGRRRRRGRAARSLRRHERLRRRRLPWSRTSARTTPTSRVTGARASPKRKPGVVKPGSTLVLGETDERLTPIFYRAGAARGLGTRPRLRMRSERARSRRTPARTADAVPHAVRDLSVAPRRAPRRQRCVRARRGRSLLLRNRSTRTSLRRPSGRSRCPGRFESSGTEPLIVLDGAHNPEAAAATAETLRDDFMQEGRRIIVAGMLQPRDPVAILEALEVDDSTLVIVCLGRLAACHPDRGASRPPPRRSAPTPSRSPTSAAPLDRARRLAAPDDAVLVDRLALRRRFRPHAPRA